VGVQVERVKSICKQHGGHEFRIGTDPEETKALWRARKEALWSACAAYPEKEAMITDVCVPLSNLPRIIGQPPAERHAHCSVFPCDDIDSLCLDLPGVWCVGETKDELEKSTLAAPMVAHAGDGNFHTFLMVDPKDADEARTVELVGSSSGQGMVIG
jgi:D-lactate dehydrogenase (cytochrome)